MFSLNRRYPFFRQLVIAIFATPLMFTGGAFLGGLAQHQAVGEVGDLDIPRAEYISRVQRGIERYRRETGAEEVPPQAQQAISQQAQSGLLSFYLLRAALVSKGVHAPDSVVAREIRKTPEFQDEDGNFSLALYEEYASDRRYYQEQARTAIGRFPLWRATTGVPMEHARETLSALRRQKRVVDEAVLPIEKLTTVAINPTAEEVNLYYQQNAGEFAERENGTFEYFIVSLDMFSDDAAPTEDDARAAYDDFVAEWDERRRLQLSHVYVGDADDAAEIYRQATDAPDAFAELAREKSEDAGSAAAGGDLGVVADGDLPDALNEAALTMTVGQIHPPVEVNDGFSILKLDAVISDAAPTFESARADMERLARQDAAFPAFEQAVEDLRELAPIEIGSLETMAATIGLSVATALTVHKNAAENDAPFDDETALIDVFAPAVISDRENSAPIPLGDDAYLFVRAARYQAPGRRPLADAAREIAGKLRAAEVASSLYLGIHQTRADNKGAGDENDAAADAAESPAADAAASADETAPTTTNAADKNIWEILENIVWTETHTVLLANDEEDDAGGLNSIDGDDANNNPQTNDREEGLDNVTIDRLYTADLTGGLPAYVFEPLENEVRIFRIRGIEDGKPLEQDREVVNELLTDMTERLSNLGYLDELSGQYRFQFYDLPHVIPPTEDSEN